MADNMKGLKRTHYCGEVTEVGQEVVVGGFVDRIRNKGGVIFIVLRDRTGIVQLLFNDKTKYSKSEENSIFIHKTKEIEPLLNKSLAYFTIPNL